MFSASTTEQNTVTRLKRFGVLLATTALTSGLIGIQASAQEADQIATADGSTADASNSEVIVVTASRAAKSGYEAPSPTQVIGADLLATQAATGVGEVLIQNPAFKATRQPGANASNLSSPAQSTADLRGLGGHRTLVLINGSRVVPFAPASNLNVPTTTDLNLIPSLMIDRVEVVTGGASAQYGSDAVAGVVNILLKRRMQGAEVRIQGGQSQEGDFQNMRAGFVAGTSFADDRAHIVVSADFDTNNGVDSIYDRDWGSREWGIVSNSQRATNGLEARILSTGVRNALGEGSVIVGPGPFSLVGQTFNSDGTLRPFDYGAISGGREMVGGEGQSLIANTDLIPDVERLATYARFEYDFSDGLVGYVEAGYSESEGDIDAVPLRLSSERIFADNAFLPAQVTTALANEGLTEFRISRAGFDTRQNQFTVTNKSPHVVAGFEGDLGNTGWTWDAHASYGKNEYYSDNQNWGRDLFRFSLDAVADPVTGNPVCRATLPGPAFDAAAAGCVPVNLFGINSATDAAVDYFYVDGFLAVDYEQTTVAANVQGELFSTWAGPISAAAGLEYRKESEELTTDPIAAVNGYISAGNAVPYTGEFDVKEGYVDFIVPLARDQPFAQLIDFNGAVRYADYNLAGGQTTWKYGAVWEPNDYIRLRATQSRDIRAPAINELFAPGGNVTGALTVNGITATIPQNTTRGNLNLEPEEADTFTAGVVFEPGGFLDGAQISLDYFDIDISGAILNVRAQTAAALCSSGNDFFCSFFTFDPVTNAPTSLLLGSINIGAFQNRGIDLKIDHSFDFAGGELTTSFGGTYTLEATVDSGTGAPVDRAGENGWANTGAVPELVANFSETYSRENWSTTLQAIYVSEGNIDNLYNTSPALTINNNDVGSALYFNLYGSYYLSDNIRVFGAVNNLFDRDPEIAPYQILASPVNGSYYDKVGRRFQIGLNFTF